jgi:hypothetical protein
LTARGAYSLVRAPASVLLVALVALVALASGCFGSGGGGGDERPPASVEVGSPDVEAGGFAECASSQAVTLAAPLRASAVADAGGLPPGIHREGERSFLWVWASYENTTRQDRVSRLNEVQLKREPSGEHALCTRVELATPTRTDGEPRSYAVAARFESDAPFPATPMRVVVNWIAGCACDPIPRGNTTATFDAPDAATIVPETS